MRESKMIAMRAVLKTNIQFVIESLTCMKYFTGFKVSRPSFQTAYLTVSFENAVSCLELVTLPV